LAEIEFWSKLLEKWFKSDSTLPIYPNLIEQNCQNLSSELNKILNIKFSFKNPKKSADEIRDLVSKNEIVFIMLLVPIGKNNHYWNFHAMFGMILTTCKIQECELSLCELSYMS
jgi:hypothetical protein